MRNALKSLSEQRREREKKFVQHADSFVAESYLGLMLFIMNYMVAMCLYQVFKKLARLMKNA